MLYGAHVSSAGGISKAIDRAEELRCQAVQVFTQSPRMWKPTAHTDEQIDHLLAVFGSCGAKKSPDPFFLGSKKG